MTLVIAFTINRGERCNRLGHGGRYYLVSDFSLPSVCDLYPLSSPSFQLLVSRHPRKIGHFLQHLPLGTIAGRSCHGQIRSEEGLLELTLAMGARMVPFLSARHSVVLCSCSMYPAISSVTVPRRTVGIRPRGPRIRPNLGVISRMRAVVHRIVVA